MCALKRIVWVASYPKSGNTWVRLFIAALRHRINCGEQPFDSNMISSQVDFHQDNARRLYEPLFKNGWSNATKADMARARPTVHDWIAKNAKSAPIVKTHNANISVDRVPTITAEATRCAIYIVRHPYDVAVSVKDHFGARDFDHAIEQMIFPNYVQSRDERFIDAPIGSWSQNVRSWTEKESPKIHVFRYEDLIRESQASFTRIASILGVSDQHKIAQAIADVDISVLKETEEKSGFVEKSSRANRFFARGRSGAGAELLSAEQKRAIAGGLSQAAALHGYQL